MDDLETRKNIYKRKQNRSCAHNARFAEDINGQEASVAHALWIQNQSLLTCSQDYCIYAYQTLYGSFNRLFVSKQKTKQELGKNKEKKKPKQKNNSTINVAVLH